MSAVVAEQPIAPASVSGAWRSFLIFLHEMRGQATPRVSFFLCSLVWTSFFATNLLSATPFTSEHVGLTADIVLSPAHTHDWWRYFCFPFHVPRGHGLLLPRGALPVASHTSLLFLFGNLLEPQYGSGRYLAMLGFITTTSAAFAVGLGLTTTFVGMEVCLWALAVLAHGERKQISGSSFPSHLRVPFNVEPRWHMWVLLVGHHLFLSSASLLQPDDIEGHPVVGGGLAAFYLPLMGMILGLLLLLRDPEGMSKARGRVEQSAPTMRLVVLHWMLLSLPPAFVSGGLWGLFSVEGWFNPSFSVFSLAKAGALGSQMNVIGTLLAFGGLLAILHPCWPAKVLALFHCLALMYIMSAPSFEPPPSIVLVALPFLAFRFGTNPAFV